MDVIHKVKPQNFHILMKTISLVYFVSSLYRKCKCDCSIRVIVLLEWLTALLEYLDLAFQALSKLLGALHLA